MESEPRITETKLCTSFPLHCFSSTLKSSRIFDASWMLQYLLQMACSYK